jgi:hypothetical protein
VHYLDCKKDARKKNGVKNRQRPSHEVDVGTVRITVDLVLV